VRLVGASKEVLRHAVLRGPAKEPLRTFRVIVDGEVGCVGPDCEPAATSLGLPSARWDLLPERHSCGTD
jgi:hypothetical protein